MHKIEMPPSSREFSIAVRKSLAVLACFAAGYAVSPMKADDSGGITLTQLAQPQEELNDTSLDIVTWNVHEKADPSDTTTDIKEIDKELEGINLFFLQEIKQDTYKMIVEQFSGAWSILRAQAEPLPGDRREQLSNVIMAKTPLSEARQWNIPGSTTTEMNLRRAAAKDKNAQKEGIDRNRTLVMATSSIQDEGQDKDLRVGTIHITYKPFTQERQLEDTLGILDKDTQAGRPQIICGDYNPQSRSTASQQGEIAEAFSLHRYMTVLTPDNQPTHRDHRVIADYCMYFSAHTLASRGVAKARVLMNKGLSSDHFPVHTRIDLGPAISSPATHTQALNQTTKPPLVATASR